jgi:hypothetical protein
MDSIFLYHSSNLAAFNRNEIKRCAMVVEQFFIRKSLKMWRRLAGRFGWRQGQTHENWIENSDIQE